MAGMVEKLEQAERDAAHWRKMFSDAKDEVRRAQQAAIEAQAATIEAQRLADNAARRAERLEGYLDRVREGNRMRLLASGVSPEDILEAGL